MTGEREYVHRKGIHCESACQCNILAAGGHDIPEEEVFGLDGSFGFSFYPVQGNAPDIIVGKQEILPLRAARLMGVEVTALAPRSAKGLAKLLHTNPAALTRVDLGLLPHWGLEARSSFGGYFINVVSAQADEFEISDPAFDTPIQISADDLDAARSSRNSPPLNPDWKVYVFGAQHASPRLDLVGPVAVRNLCRDLLKPGNRSLGMPGLQRLQTIARSWPETKQGDVEDIDLDGKVTETTALARQLVHLGRQIETFGTGGGLFRPMIGRFLTRVALSTGETRYEEAAELFSSSGENWKDLGTALLGLDFGSPQDQLENLVAYVADTAKLTLDQEKQALSSLVAL